MRRGFPSLLTCARTNWLTYKSSSAVARWALESPAAQRRAAGAVAVLCLAFPLEPPRRAGKPPQSRLPELEAVTVPTLVVQGMRDRFGMPPPGPAREVVKVQGDHGLKADLEAVAAAVQAWLPQVVAEVTPASTHG